MAAVTYEILPGEEMWSRYRHGHPRINRRILERIRYLHVEELRRETHVFCRTDANRIVGDLGLQQSPEEVDVFWVKHVSVDPAFRGRGVATELLRLAVLHAAAEGKRLELSRYTEDGLAYLPRVIERLRATHPGVGIIDPPNAPSPGYSPKI